MKRFITLILMLTTLLTFTQKVMAFAPVLENEMLDMNNCPMMPMVQNSATDDVTECDNSDLTGMMECQNDCEFMTVVSVLYFVEHEHGITQPLARLNYTHLIPTSPYYFSDPLYRPPFNH